MSVDTIETRLQANATKLAELGAKLKFDFGADGKLLVDATTTPATLSRDDVDADCTIHISADDMLKMMDGDLNGMMAFTMGKLRVSGDMSIAMRLNAAIEG